MFCLAGRHLRNVLAPFNFLCLPACSSSCCLLFSGNLLIWEKLGGCLLLFPMSFAAKASVVQYKRCCLPEGLTAFSNVTLASRGSSSQEPHVCKQGSPPPLCTPGLEANNKILAVLSQVFNSLQDAESIHHFHRWKSCISPVTESSRKLCWYTLKSSGRTWIICANGRYWPFSIHLSNPLPPVWVQSFPQLGKSLIDLRGAYAKEPRGRNAGFRCDEVKGCFAPVLCSAWKCYNDK